ncbi:hypothetical protein [Chitinophaga flava]|uniref:DUF5689 domain-containing protein n=1 Tax=Chitinophaga flava TaxID=2259036 RepID=A0A365Y2D8_9BACT|nr:hypothetical protein [Chitinophaga flava]RBL92763.1 hypothetical protein DF182_09350 [Chitinophaga flava]
MLAIHHFFNRAALLSLLLVVLFSCRKTDNYAQEINDTPYLITGEIPLGPNKTYSGFRSSYLVGDTAMLIGRLFLERPGSRILVGGQPVKIEDQSKLSYIRNEYTKQAESLDIIRFVITQEMGLGDHIPISLVANGQTIQAPEISIRKFAGSMHRTDTTLYVDLLTNWKPANSSLYQQKNRPLINNVNLTSEGDIYFSNNTEIDVYKGGKITQLINVNDQFQENGTTFAIKMIQGSAVAYDGNTLTFSAEVTETIPEAATSYIYRLCKMELATQKITTINRTLVTKGRVTVNEVAGPFEGAIGTLKVVATQLKTDMNGALYFVNNYAPARTDWVNEIDWYSNGWGPSFYYISPTVYANICRVDAGGSVKSIFKLEEFFMGPSYYNIPGRPLELTTDYVLSPDGKTAFGTCAVNSMGSIFKQAAYDLEHDEILMMPKSFYFEPYRFFSYDTAAVTGYHKSEMSFGYSLNDEVYLNHYCFTTEGELLAADGVSIAAVDLVNKSLYCYAGTEMGIGTTNAPWQDQKTGPAKKINFGTETMMIGQDKYGNVIYTGSRSNYNQGVTFYKLHSRK